MKVWITTVSTSAYAAFNTLWAGIKHFDYLPRKVHLLANLELSRKHHLSDVRTGFECILEGYEVDFTIEVHTFEETDFVSYAKTIGQLVFAEKRRGNTVAIDMTPGRKYMSALSLYLGLGSDIEYKADKVFYHHLSDLSYGRRPYPLIPANLPTLYDLKDKTKEAF